MVLLVYGKLKERHLCTIVLSFGKLKKQPHIDANKISLVQIEDHNAYLYDTGAFSHGLLLDKNLIWYFSRTANTWFHFKTAKKMRRGRQKNQREMTPIIAKSMKPGTDS